MNLCESGSFMQKLLTLLILMISLVACTSTGKTLNNNFINQQTSLKTQAPNNSGQKEFPKGFRYRQFISSQTWFIADFITLWRSTDAGTSWSQSYKPQEVPDVIQYIRGVSFVDEQTGFLVDREKLYKTADGGASWHAVGIIKVGDEDCYLDSCYFINACSFVNSLQGRVAGLMWRADSPERAPEYEGVLLRTKDGGQSWSRQRLKLPQNHRNKIDRWSLNDVVFFNMNSGWVVGDNVIFRTTDGGQTWQLGKIEGREYTGSFVKVKFLDERNGWILTKHSREFLVTDDGGENWKVCQGVKTNAQGYSNNLIFIKPDVGFDIDSNLFITRNGGKSWTKLKTNISEDKFSHIDRLPDGRLVAICSGDSEKKVLISQDEGLTWK
jgi:photosystem II stability/assembly factor-like uncharacterized protein